MKVNIPSTLKSLKIDFVELEEDVFGSSVTFTDEGSLKFPIVFFQWTAEDEKDYVRLIIVPFIERPNGGFTPNFIEQVLSLNEQLPRAKFLLDSDGDLGLALDIDVEDWGPENLSRALDILGPFADYYYAELWLLTK